MERKIYSPDLEKEIWEKIEQVEKTAQKRLVDNSDIRQILKAVREIPHGTAYADGGHVPNRYKYPASTTYVEIAWSTRRGIKWVAYSVRRGNAKKVHYGAYSSYFIEHDEKKAFEEVFRDRVKRSRRYILKRALRLVGFTDQPEKITPSAEQYRLVEKERDGIALFVADGNFILITPLGIFKETKKGIQCIDEALKFIKMTRDDVTNETMFPLRFMRSPKSLYREVVDINKITDLSIKSAIEERPYGVGFIAKKVYSSFEDLSYEFLSWYTRIGEKKVVMSKDIGNYIHFFPTARTPRFLVVDDKKMAWELTFLDRAHKYEQIIIKRKIRAIGISKEKIPEGELEIRKIWPGFRMAIVFDREWKENFLLTPVGSRGLPKRSFKSATEAFREAFGFSLPRKRDIDWEDIEALIALRAIGG